MVSLGLQIYQAISHSMQALQVPTLIIHHQLKHHSMLSSVPTPTATTVAVQPVDNTMTIIGVGVAIIIVVAIVGALTIMMLRKRP